MTMFGFTADQPKDDSPVEVVLPDRIPDTESYSFQEKSLRDLFITEYLVDFDETKASLRCGFQFQFATEYGRKFLEEPYVQRRISEIRTLANRDEEQVTEYNKRRIIEQLLAEAYYKGKGSSQAARVAALRELKDFYGMGGASARKSAAGANGPAGGVMVVPAIANVEDWEATAQASQAALRADIAEDQK